MCSIATKEQLHAPWAAGPMPSKESSLLFPRSRILLYDMPHIHHRTSPQHEQHHCSPTPSADIPIVVRSPSHPGHRSGVRSTAQPRASRPCGRALRTPPSRSRAAAASRRGPPPGVRPGRWGGVVIGGCGVVGATSQIPLLTSIRHFHMSKYAVSRQ